MAPAKLRLLLAVAQTSTHSITPPLPRAKPNGLSAQYARQIVYLLSYFHLRVPRTVILAPLNPR